MDGFEPTEKIVIIAATNRADVLDAALLRPGRFDRSVMLDLPDRKDRLAILQIHSGEKPLAEGVRLDVIAERTPGLSGADLQSVMNEGAIFAARDNRTTLEQNANHICIQNMNEKLLPITKQGMHWLHQFFRTLIQCIKFQSLLVDILADTR